MPRDSVDYKRASTVKSTEITRTYQRFHAFIDLQIGTLKVTSGSLLNIMLVNTLDGIKRQCTVNIYNLFVRSGKLSEKN